MAGSISGPHEAIPGLRGRGRLYHYRTTDKQEVDAVIETPDGRVIGVEVKAGATVRTEDLTGLRNLANHLEDRLVMR